MQLRPAIGEACKQACPAVAFCLVFEPFLMILSVAMSVLVSVRVIFVWSILENEMFDSPFLFSLIFIIFIIRI